MAVVQQQPGGVQTGAVWRTLGDGEGSWENGIDRLYEKVDYLGKKLQQVRWTNGEKSRLGTQKTMKIKHTIKYLIHGRYYSKCLHVNAFINSHFIEEETEVQRDEVTFQNRSLISGEANF